jgi:hypothetical protein
MVGPGTRMLAAPLPMDGPTTILVVLAAFPIFGLGAALLFAPVPTMAALNQWYLVPPAVRSSQRVRVAVVRVCGAAVMFLAVWLEVQAVTMVVALFS